MTVLAKTSTSVKINQVFYRSWINKNKRTAHSDRSNIVIQMNALQIYVCTKISLDVYTQINFLFQAFLLICHCQFQCPHKIFFNGYKNYAQN